MTNLADHTELRRTLQALLAAARSIIDGQTESEIELREAISALALAFDQHFWMTEKHLAPTIVDDPVQANLLLDEHRQQREMVFALLSEATAGDKAGAALADDACWLVESLLKDIHREDQRARENVSPARPSAPCMVTGLKTVLALVLLTACDVSSGETNPAPRSAPSAAPSGSSTAMPAPMEGGAKEAGPHTASESLLRCAESKGEIGSIADAVARLGALAPNGDGPCFVATLPRPLAVVATLGVTSAQPAGGRGAPRIFFMLPKIVISVVPSGDGSKVVEFGEWMGTTRTLKGEIGLPVTGPLAAGAPFSRVLQGTDRTLCATCHRQEEPHPTIPNAFVSLAFQPEPGTFVTVTELEELHALCTQADDPGPRCTMIHALFDFGEITQGSFAPVVETFFPGR